MKLPHDLKNWRSEDDAFVVLSGDAVVMWLTVCLFIGYVLKDVL